MAKRYYWLKLKEDFFERDEIKILEGLPNGKDYIIFYMKLLLKSISSDGILIFNGCIPFTPEMLASVTNTSIDTVIVATKTLIDLGLMEQWNDGKLFMVMTQNMIGSEGESAARVRALRERKKSNNLLQCNASVTKCNTDIDIDIDIDKEKDIEIDIDKYIAAWNSLGLNRLVSIKNKRYSYLKARIEDYGEDKVIEAIESINNSNFLKGNNKKNWKITFDWLLKPNNFVKVLEGNYLDNKTEFNNFEPREIYKDEKQMKELENKLLGWDKED